MKTALIAALCHGINTAFCASIGDTSHLPWEETPDELKKSIEFGVKLHLENPETTPEQSHASWLATKEADGWTYGEVKDFEAKTHPNIRPYDELPLEQKSKDYLFKAVVNLVKDLPDPDDVLALSAELVKLQTQLNAQPKVEIASRNATTSAGVTIAYVGYKDQFVDNLYGTQLVFNKDVPRTVPSNYATKFLSHPEFQVVAATEANVGEVQDDTAEILKQQEEKKQQEDEQLNRNFNEIESIKQFGTKKAVVDYIKANYGEDIVGYDKIKLDDLKQKAIDKVNQFGAI